MTPNFSLAEFLVSETATRHDIDMTPPPEVVENIERLASTILQPLRDALSAEQGRDVPIIVTSGFRPPALNRLIGGSPRSQHMLGEAADIRAIGYTPDALCRRIRELELPVHQCINEFGQWVHVSGAPFAQEPRGEYLIAAREDGRTVYRRAA